MRKFLISLIASCACSVMATAQTDIYVSPRGDDSAPGTIDRPVATLSRAMLLARQRAGHDDVTIYCREGKHRLTQPLEIGPDINAGGANRLTIRSYPGEKAIISSAEEIKCNWEHYRDGIMRAHLPEGIPGDNPDRLFVGGEPQHMARYPNYNPSIRIFSGYADDAISPARVRRWKNPAGGYLHAMHRAEWGGFQYTIDGKSSDTTLVLGAGFQNNRMDGMHPRYRMVENIFEELDTIGEWFYDPKEKDLYYCPADKNVLADMPVETPTCESLFIIKGSPDRPVRNINIEDLELTETRRTFLLTSEPLLRSDWKIHRGGAILLENAEDCHVTGCHIHQIGGNAIFLSGKNRRNTIERNHIEHIGASAVCLVGRPEAVRSPLFEYNQRQDWDKTDHTPGPLNDEYPDSCLVADNLIHSVGEVEKQGAGVQISMAMNITVSHNSIYRLPRAGINISEGTWGGHVIEWNDVFETVLETGDHGAFNSWGRDRYWHPDRQRMDSLTARHPETPTLDAIHTTVLRFNRWRCDHGWDIDLDDGSSNYHIYGNVCLNGGIKLREGFRRTVENNVMINNGFHPHVWFRDSRDIFRHNILTGGYCPIGISWWGDDIDHNFFADANSLAQARADGTDSGSLAGNPGFIDAAIGDYRVNESSDALKTGFCNFAMNRFGVTYPPLLALAERPVIPEINNILHDGRPSAELMKWNGITFKTITTEGERSATGIDAVRGVMVIANSNPDVDLRPNDVILSVDNTDTDDTAALEKALKAKKTGSHAEAVRVRNQSAEKMRIRIAYNQ